MQTGHSLGFATPPTPFFTAFAEEFLRVGLYKNFNCLGNNHKSLSITLGCHHHQNSHQRFR